MTATTPVAGLKETARDWVRATLGAPPDASTLPRATIAFTWMMMLLTGWGVVASYMDGWAHNRDKADSFFTWWHLNLYSSLGGMSLFVGYTAWKNHKRGFPWVSSFPAGYEHTVLGMVLFGIGGFGDMIWHGLFGIEPGNEALVAPMHLILATGGGLIIVGLLSSAWQSAENQDIPDWMKMLFLAVPIAYLLSMVTFMSQFYHAFGRTGSAKDYYTDPSLTVEVTSNTLELASIMIQSFILVGLVLLFVRHGRLRPGSMTVILVINIALMTYMKSNRLATGALPLVGVALLAGILADLALWKLRPSQERTVQFRLFALLVPIFLYGLYFLAILAFGGGIEFSVHVWTGAVVVAGLVGWLTSYFVVPTPLLRTITGPPPAAP